MRERFWNRQSLWLASFVGLPYFMYGALLVMTGLMVTAMVQRGRQVWQLCGQVGFGWLTAGLLLSASFGLNRGDAFLQLSNFLPFFVLWGVFATNSQVLSRPFATLETLARWLVLSAVPLCAIAVIEYIFKFEHLMAQIKALPLPQWLLGWLYEEPYFGHRARSLFDHPNGLSAYLVMILGLGLGLLLKALSDRAVPTASSPPTLQLATPPASLPSVDSPSVDSPSLDSPSADASKLASQSMGPLVVAVVLCLTAIFCTGSRNGVLIALVLVAIALYSARRYRWAWLSGVMGASAIASAVLSFGIGGRSLSLAIFMNDPRIGVWQLATEMIQQRPWLGWGFSGLRELYVPDSIPGYDSIFHAHNIWLFLASESGIPVMLGFCAIVGTIMYRATRAYLGRGAHNALAAGEKAVLLSYLLAFLACLLFALFDVVFFDARLNVPAWGLLAALYRMSRPD